MNPYVNFLLSYQRCVFKIRKKKARSLEVKNRELKLQLYRNEILWIKVKRRYGVFEY